MKKKKSNLSAKCERVGTLLMLVILLQSFGIGVSRAQSSDEPRLTVEFSETPFIDVINYIKRHTKFDFLYNNEEVQKILAVTHSFKSVPASQVLQSCLEGTEYTFRLFQNMIVIQKRQKTLEPVTVRGKVLDEKGMTLPGATVIVKGTSIGGSTNDQGMFVFSLPKMDTIYLLVSFVGMETREVGITNFNQEVVVRMKPDTKGVEEVVVTGYGNVRKTSFTGNSVTVSRDELLKVSKTNVMKALEVYDPSFRVKTNNQWGSDPNALPEMQIRGQSSIGVKDLDRNTLSKSALENNPNLPIFIMDNFETTIQKVYDMDPNRIESITILKDAAATALYGSRAANGVVVITTKKGKKGTMTVNYSGEFTIRMKPSYSQFNLMNSQEQMMVYEEMEEKGWLNYADISRDKNGGVYKKMADLISTYDPATGKFGLENTPQAKAAFLQKYEMANTDWFDVLFRNSLQQVHSLSLSSGSERSRFYASLSYFNDAGWTLADKVNRYTANMNASFDIKPWISVNLLTTNSLRMQKAPGTNSRRTNAVDGTFERDFDINPFSYALNTSRTLRPYDDNGNYEYYTMNYAPFSILNELNTNKLNIDMLDAKFQAELEIRPLKGLEVKALGAVRYVKTTREHRINDKSNAAEAYRADMDAQIRDNNKFLYKDPDNPGYPAKVVMPKGGFYNRDENTMLNYYQRGILNYNTSFNEGIHTLNVMAGEEVRYTNRTIAFNKGFGYQWDRGGVPFLDPDLLKQQIENGVDYYGMEEEYDRFAAFFGTVGYSYNGTYIFNVTGRYDGSNKLGKSRSARWLPTWNVSGAWHVTNEKFMGPVETISRLTLRATYGLTASMGPSSN